MHPIRRISRWSAASMYWICPPYTDRLIRQKVNSARERTAPFKAVMQVLRLGRQQGSILPNRSIRQIRVDRQIGLTLYAFDRIKTINLGYDDYDGKYHMLANLFSYLKKQKSGSDFDRIDLNNLDRVVVNPVRIESGQQGIIRRM